MKRPRLPRCRANDRKGVRCGRSVSRVGADYCHLHAPRPVAVPIIEQKVEESSGPEQQHDQPTGTSTIVPEPPAVSTTAAADAESVVEVEPVATAQSPYRLSEDLYKDAGLLRLRDEKGRAIGKWTHAYGDEYAAKILDGRIPFEQAKRDHLDAIRHLVKWADSRLPKEKRVSYV